MRMFAFLLLFCSTAIAHHPIYLSRTEIYYRPQRQSLEISMKVFADDWQSSLSALHGEAIEIGTDREHPDATRFIQGYLRERFWLVVNDELREWEYVGRENDETDLFAIWIYLRVSNVPALRSLVVHNSLLHEYQEAQENIVILQRPEGIERQSARKDFPMVEFRW